MDRQETGITPFILWNQDENGLAAIRSSQPYRIYELDANPTAENMAVHFLENSLSPRFSRGPARLHTKCACGESEETCAEVAHQA